MKYFFLPIRLCFINVYVYAYPNHKPTPYNNEKIVIIVVQFDKNYAVLTCACPVAPYVSLLALTPNNVSEGIVGNVVFSSM